MSKELGRTGMSGLHCAIMSETKSTPVGTSVDTELRKLGSQYSDQEDIKINGNKWLASVKTGVYSVSRTGTPTERK